MIGKARELLAAKHLVPPIIESLKEKILTSGSPYATGERLAR